MISSKNEEDAKKRDSSKSIDELKSIDMDCMNKSMPEQTVQSNNSGGDLPGGETEGPEMPEGAEM